MGHEHANILRRVATIRLEDTTCKVTQFDVVFHTLTKGRPISDFGVYKDLLHITKLKHSLCKHWLLSDVWNRVGHMHAFVLQEIMRVMIGAPFISITCDIVMCVVNQT